MRELTATAFGLLGFATIVYTALEIIFYTSRTPPARYLALGGGTGFALIVLGAGIAGWLW